ncbi:MAG: lamin tail domain-containing protein [Ferruginibacter sp.]
MQTKSILYGAIFSLMPFTAKTQFVENFSDGNFTSNPAWTGNTASWNINLAFQLQSNHLIANSSFYLSTVSTLALSAQWEFYVNLKFATSSTNYVDVYIIASASDLSAANTTGYFVRIGNTNDEISLYRKDAGAVNGVKIIDGIDGVVNSSTNNVAKIKLTRNATNQWSLFRDMSGTGNNFFNEGTIADATFTTAAYFGILIKQSSIAGFAQKHFFDDIIVKPYTPDITAPAIQSVTAITANNIDVLFDEPIDIASGQTLMNYSADNGLTTPLSAMADSTNAALVHLVFTAGLKSGTTYQLLVNNVADLAGNPMINAKASFVYFAPYTARQNDVLIDEIMADPSPSVALPASEWIELKNTSVNAIDLLGWKIGNALGESRSFPATRLLPDSFVIICAANTATAMSVFGNVIGVTGFPSLDNVAGQLYLKSSNGNIIHSVSYTTDWYRNELKKNGGWTLEMIDTKNPCSGFSNWKASIDSRGGSPGIKNSIDGTNTDKSPPRLLRAYAADSLHVTLVFDEPLDSSAAISSANFIISDGIGNPVVAVPVAPLFDRINLQLKTALLHNKVYNISVTNLPDCAGNTNNKMEARAGLPEVAAPSDIVINEVLFNPTQAATDYVEMYNRSDKIIDLKQTYIANRNNAGAISSIAQLSNETYLLFPKDFIVITENTAQVKAAYITQNPDAFIEIAKMPSFNDDKGNVVLLNAQGAITDELAYSEKWHFKLIINPEGVSLERINYNTLTQSPDNWHSAAGVAYGTPGFKNSQFNAGQNVAGDLIVSPEIVSPDNDGQDDFATLNYVFPSSGYVANITVFDASGRPVRFLQRNALCGTTGTFRWDGLGEKSQQLPIGVYILFTEVFNLKGNLRQFKNVIVLARRN